MRWLAPSLLVGLLACEPEPGTGPTDGAPTGDTAVDLCDGEASPAWETFAAGFFTQNCQSCHASTTLERQGAPESVTFDTEAEVLAMADRILARATGDAPDMPPEGGVPADDRLLLEIWLSCTSE